VIGFDRKSTAPSECASAGSRSTEQTTTGRSRVAGSPLSWRRTRQPSCEGIITSSITRSGRRAAASVTASSGIFASTIRYGSAAT